MEKIPLPPLLSSIENGKITWKKLNEIDYDQIGFLLCCHLIIEHYLDEFIKCKSGKNFNWVAAKLTFNQKASLLSTIGFPNKYNSIPAIKHLNALRNKLSHNIDTHLSKNDFLPILHFLEKTTGTPIETESITELLNLFTITVCSWFAAILAFEANPAIDDQESRRQFEQWMTHLSSGTPDDAS